MAETVSPRRIALASALADLEAEIEAMLYASPSVRRTYVRSIRRQVDKIGRHVQSLVATPPV